MSNEIIAAIAGSMFGFIFGWIPFFFERYNKLNGCCHALIAEIKKCFEMSKTYENDGIKSPLYRLPIIAWQHAYPRLLEEGIFDKKEVIDLQNFYIEVETINRGLDQVDEIRRTSNSEIMGEEVERILKKVKNLEQKYKEIENYRFPYQGFTKYLLSWHNK